eukprot:4519091-Amphidinium_carterae.1
MGGLLKEHGAGTGSRISAVRKETQMENHAVYNVIRAWDHQLRLAGHSLVKFIAEEGHSRILEPGEVRYMARTEAYAEYGIPEDSVWQRSCIKNVRTGAKRFEASLSESGGPMPCLFIDMDESSINLAATQYLQHSLNMRLIHIRDPCHRTWNDMRQSLQDCDLWADVLEKNHCLGLQHAPWKSSAFFRQMQESAELHVQTANGNNPLMAALQERMEADVIDRARGCRAQSVDVQDLFKQLQTSISLVRQGSRTSLTRWFEFISRWKSYDAHYTNYLYLYCLILYFSGKVESVMDLPVWDEDLGAAVVEARVGIEETGKKVSGKRTMQQEQREKETQGDGKLQRKAMNSVHLGALILGNKGSQRRGKIILEVAAPVESAFNTEVQAISRPETMKEVVMKYAVEGCSKVLLDVFAVLRDADALERMRFCMHARNQGFYTSQLGVAGGSAGSRSASSAARKCLRRIEIHETDAEDSEMAELLFKLVTSTVRNRALSMTGYTCCPPGELLLLVSGEGSVVAEGLARQKKNWEVLVQSEAKQFEFHVVRDLLKEIGWLHNVAVREILVALAQHEFRMVPPGVSKILENMVGGFGSTLVCEKAFQKLRDIRRESQSERTGRLTRFYWPVASQLLQEMGRKEVSPTASTTEDQGMPRTLPQTVFHCEGLPCSLPDEAMTRMKKEVRGKKDFLSTNARGMMLQSGAWRLLCHVAGAKTWKDLHKCWVNQLFDEESVYLQKSTGKYWLALKVTRFGVLAWPLGQHMRGELVFYGLSAKAGCQPEWLHAFDARDWEYQPTACMPPSVVKSLSPGAKPF